MELFTATLTPNVFVTTRGHAKRNTVSRSTFADASNITFAISPDSKQLVISTIAGTLSGEIWIQPNSGSGNQQKLERPMSFVSVTSWSPNRRYIYIFFWSQDNATRQDIYYVDLNGDRKFIPFLHSPANENDAVLSPNGKWLAYASDESGRFEVYVTAFPDPGGKWQVSNGGGGSPSWSADGKQLYYDVADRLMLVPIQNLNTFEFGAPPPYPFT